MTLESLVASKKSFKQQERMIDRIRGLITDYPLSATLKELLQNADDAGATNLNIYFDLRMHNFPRLKGTSLARLNGPAVLVCNDRKFKQPDDFDGIQNVGRGAKATNRSKLGRYGVGFCSVYNITDYPCLVSGDQFAICDPHAHLFPPDEGGRWDLCDIWAQYPELLAPFCNKGLLTHGCNDFSGTIFRFPLRDADRAGYSEISSQIITKSDLDSVTKQVEKYGASYLLFLKHLLSLKLSTIMPNGHEFCNAKIETLNQEKVKENRNSIVQLLAMEQSDLFSLLRDKTAQLTPVCYQHSMQVDTTATAYNLHWQVCQGIFSDPGQQLVAQAEKLAPLGTKVVDKAVPWAGVAALLPLSEDPPRRPPESAAPEGLVFCGLPLGFCTELQPEQRLPVHIHGFFDLDTSRYAPAANPEEAGKGALGVRWNQLLVEHAIAPAYAELLAALAGLLGNANPEDFYALWPPVPCQLPGVLVMLGESVYRLLFGRQVVRRAGTAAWVMPKELLLPPPELQAPLAADQCPIPEPPLPTRIIEGFRRSNVPMKQLMPATLCSWLRDESFPRTPISTARRASLRQRSSLVALLKFCLSDPQTQLKGLPLALLADGTLAPFSPSRKTFLCTKDEHEILSSFANRLIAYEYGIECGLKQQNDSGLYRMDLPGLIRSIKNIFVNLTPNASVDWSPDNETHPNMRWLIKVFKYFKKIKGLTLQKHLLLQVPLVPDQFNRLWPMGTDRTPLLWDDGELGSLRDAVDSIGVSRVVGSPEFLAEVNQFVREQGSHFIRFLNHENLVSAMQSHQAKIAGLAYQPAVHHALLNYLLPWYGSQPQKASLLKTLPIFPTSTDAVTAIQNVPVCLAPGFALPHSLVLLVTLYEGPQNSWRTALEAIGVQRLDHTAIIRSHLLPAYGRLAYEERYETLRWIRDHFVVALGELMQCGGASAVDVFKKQLREAELIRASDDKFYPAQRLYDPDKCGLPDVLVGRVLFPHRGQYAQEREQWLDFFRKLGLNQQPHPIDLLDCIRHLSTVALAGDLAAAIPLLKDVWDHLQEHGKELLKEQLPGTTGTLAQALRGLAWLPARRTSTELASYPGAQFPTARLYCPSEMHLVSNGYLIASQGNLMLFDEPRAFLREALQIPVHPPLDQVMDHFAHLIAQWELPQHGGLTADGVRKAVGSIYRYFGGLLKGPSSDSDREKQTAVDLNRMRGRFAKQRCIWVDGRQEFVLPTHTFAKPVYSLGASRFCIRIVNESEDRGLTALGRREAPTTEDYIDHLRELQTSSQGQPLPVEAEQQALEALRQLSLVIGQGGGAPPIVPLLTRRGLLIDSTEVIVNHDKWYDEYASFDGVHLLHAQVSPGLIAALRLRKLTEEIKEIPVGVLRQSLDAQLIEQAKSWSTTLRTPEFRSALIRLIRHHRQFVRVADLQWISNVTVCVVKPIQAELWIKPPGTPARRIGTTDCSSHFIPEKKTIYLSDQEPILAASFLASELNRQLDDLSLPTVSELVQLLGVPPERMDQVLTKLRVSIDFEAGAQEIGDGTVRAQKAVVEEWRGTEVPSEADASDVHDQNPSPSSEQDPTTEARSGDSRPAVPAAPSPAEACPPAQTAASDNAATPTASPPTVPPVSPPRDTPPSSAQTYPRPSYGYYGGNWNQSSHLPALPAASGSAADGRSHAPVRPSGKAGRLVSYVFPEGIASWYAELGFDEAQWLRLQQQGIERVQREERGGGRSFRAAEEGNPGYSLVSELPNGEDVRYHLVKALPGPWAEAGVAFSSAELRAAQQLGAAFWLHVVEYAMDDQEGPYTLIHNPAQKITQFRLDRGWKAATAPEAAMTAPLLPEVGQIWRHTSLGEADILQVVGSGKHKRLYVRWRSPGPQQPAEQWHTFIRSQMQFVRPTE